MEKYVSVLKKSKIFEGIKEEELKIMLNCLNGQVRKYKKDEYIYTQGDRINHLSVLLEGKLHILKDDYWGNRSIINVVLPSEMFGESFIAKEGLNFTNDVTAVTDSTVIFFDLERVLSVCPSGCRFHALTVKNLFFAISEKNRQLVGKLNHMAKRTTREKLISYLSEEAAKRDKSTFEIPFNRQQLADFLSVDRSAMSRELCRMQEEGLIEFKKNRFSLLD